MPEINSLARQLKPVFGWHQARIVFLSHFILAVIKTRSANLSRLAVMFGGTAQTASNYKRLQRFLRSFDIDFDQAARIIAQWMLPSGNWTLSLDRTNWDLGLTKINFLVLGVAVDGVAIPLFWMLLGKKGNSNTAERIELMDRFLHVFGIEKIAYLTADREFRGGEWLSYLSEKHIPFCIRIPNNTKVSNKHKNRKLNASRIFSLRVGESMTLSTPREIWGVKVFLSCIRSPKERVIMATSRRLTDAGDVYAKRWSIETLFGCLKTRGFDLESTHVRADDRLQKLFFLLTLAMCWCFKVGLWRNEQKPIKIKRHGKKSVSIFRYGLDYLQAILVAIHSKLESFVFAMRFLSCT